MTDSKAFRVSNAEGDHLGFILMAGGPEEGQCLVRSLPFESRHFDAPESQYLYSLQQLGELDWRRESDRVRIFDSDGDVALTECEGRMTGAGFVYGVESAS